jgi:DNA mismatch repair protein MutL
VSEHRPIRRLSPGLVNRIAAGEVIERPASVVKELVENALDAGASLIVVEIGDGGRELIRVGDDGCGIPPEELPLALAAHATSKLSSDEDLGRIGTMGFRGEALASIAAVSHSRLVSRRIGTADAWEIGGHGEAIGAVQATAGNPGTTVEIRNLFFNTPARRKFLKGTATEFGHISETVVRLALPFPAVAFRLVHDGRTVLELPAGSAADRLLAAWPDDWRGRHLPIDIRDGELVLQGLIGLPELARPTPKYQFFYINGRSVRDRFIQHAVRESFRGLTELGRHPAAVLQLSMATGDVDVNVHPTKAEVRFRDSARIHGLVLMAVRQRLLASDLAPLAVTFRDDQPGLPPANPDGSRPDLREKLAAFFRAGLNGAPGPIAASIASPMPNPATGSAGPAQPWELQTAPAQSNFPMPPGDRPWASPIPAAPGIADGPDFASPAGGEATVHHPAASATGAIQLHNSYLVAQSDDGLVIIDQHALHERMVYEDLLARLGRGTLESQRLLVPATVAASGRQIELLEQIQPLLARLGIEAGPFGPGTVAVQSFPSFMHRLDPGLFVRELLERGEQELLDLGQEELLHEILDMMACKAAIKAGDRLSPAEIEALLAARHLVGRSSNCPHGRPTTLRLSLRDLEKQFKRTGF